MKKLIIAEKPSVARQFAQALHVSGNHDGYIENDEWVITWALGHLVTLSYPEKYDEKFAKWKVEDLPFLPQEYKYEVIKDSAKQYKVVNSLYHRSDICNIYNAGDSGREGEYIQRLVLQETGCTIPVKRVWINSQTEEEILRGIREAKDSSEYDNLAAAAYMRGIEDYAVGINFSRLLSLLYGNELNEKIKSKKYIPVAVGRVMTCVLAMVVAREREIRAFKPTDYYKLQASLQDGLTASWKAVPPSRLKDSPLLYDEAGFKAKHDAQTLLTILNSDKHLTLSSLSVKEEKKIPPLLFNLAELQSVCSKELKISPSDTLQSAQKLYEARLTTYPRTDARVLSTAVAKEIKKNLSGLAKGPYHNDVAQSILDEKRYEGIAKTKYTDDNKITDHYAIIPTGNTAELAKMAEQEVKVYHLIVDRFLSIFLPAAIYKKYEATFLHKEGEPFFLNDKILIDEGYLCLYDTEKEHRDTPLALLKEGSVLDSTFEVKTATTTPPKRYTSGSLILAMENAGKLIEDEELREQIKGSGIGTSATRADTIKKLCTYKYIALNNKNQTVTPTNLGESIYDIVQATIPTLLSAKMTASWEKGLAGIESGEISADVYRQKLEDYIRKQVEKVKEVSPAPPSGEPHERTEVGKCPVCGKPVFVTRKGSWLCSGWEKDKKGCFFSLPAAILEQMTDEQKKNFLVTGDTGLVKNVTGKNGSKYAVRYHINGDEMTFDLQDTFESDYKCPNCGKTLTEERWKYTCSCGFAMDKYVAKTKIPKRSVDLLFKKGQCPPITITKKDGSTFTAGLALDEKTGNVLFTRD